MSDPAGLLNVIRFPIGGIRSYLRYTYSRLDPEFYRPTILTVDREEAKLLPAGMAPLHVDLRTVPERRAFIGLTIGTDRLLRTGRFAIVHSQGTTAAVSSDLSTRRHRVPHVITLHETFQPEQFAGALGALRRFFVTRALDRASAIVAVTNDARENLLAHVPLAASTRDRVIVSRNGVAVDLLIAEAPATRLELRRREGVDPDSILLGYIGRFMPEKGFDVLLDAVDRLRKSGELLPKFVVVAVNDGAFLREYLAEIDARGLRSSFIFAGFQPSAAGILTEIDAVVMPSRREACGIVAMEALVLGCPLIASDCVGLREVVAGTPALSTHSGDAQSLAAAIREFLIGKARLKAAADAYVPTARAAFDSSRPASTLHEVLQAAMRAR